MERRRLRPVQLFCSDLDGTLVGDAEAVDRFQQSWAAAPVHPVLVYSSGRLLEDMHALLRETPLPRADFLIGGVGTAMFDVAANENIDGFAETLGDGWDLAAVERVIRGVPGAVLQPDEFLNSRKSSWYLRDADPATIAGIESELLAAGVKARVVYSSSRDLDILPYGAAKGAALAWLCRTQGVSLDATVVAGDSGNDASMFLLPRVRGILVGNALPELIAVCADAETFQADAPGADGVIAGLRHYGMRL